MASSSHSSARGGHDGDGVEQRARAPSRRAARASTASRTVVGSVAAAGREHLGHEERVAGGRAGAARRRRRPPCRPAPRPRPATAARAAIRSTACAAARRARSAADGAVELVVAVGRQHERRQRLDPAGEQAHDVERGLVGPVQILQHDDARRPPAELARERRDDIGAARRPPRRRRASSPPASCAMSSERPERTRRVTARRTRPTARGARRCPAQNARTSVVLPMPGLAGDEHEPPASLARAPRRGAPRAPRAVWSARAARRRGSGWSRSPPHSGPPPPAVGLSTLPLTYRPGVFPDALPGPSPPRPRRRARRLPSRLRRSRRGRGRRRRGARADRGTLRPARRLRDAPAARPRRRPPCRPGARAHRDRRRPGRATLRTIGQHLAWAFGCNVAVIPRVLDPVMASLGDGLLEHLGRRQRPALRRFAAQRVQPTRLPPAKRAA